MITLHVRALTDRPGRALAMLATIVAVVTLPVAILVVSASVDASVAQLAALSAPVDLLVEAAVPGGLRATDLDAVAELPDVAVAAPVIIETVNINRRPTTLYGSNLLLGELGGSFSPALSAGIARYRDQPGLLFNGIFLGDRVASDLGVAAAESVEVVGGDAVTSTTVHEVVDGATFNDGAFAFALLAYARELSGRPVDSLDVILVQARPGADTDTLGQQIAEILPAGVSVSSPTALAELAAQRIAGPVRLVLFLGLLTAAIGSFVVTGMVLLSVESRRTELALLRALGASSRGLVAGTLAEFVIVAVVAVPPGGVLGRLVGAALIHRLPTAVLSRTEVSLAVGAPAGALGIALLVAIVVVVGGSLPTIRRVVATSPVAGLGDATLPVVADRPDTEAALDRHRDRVVAGAVMGVAGLLLASGVGPGIDGSPPGLVTVLLVGGFALATHAGRAALAEVVARVNTDRGQRGSMPRRLAAASCRADADRTWATVGAIALGAMGAVAVTGMTADVRAELHDRFDVWERSGVVVQAGSLTDPASTRVLDPDVDARLTDLFDGGVVRVWRTPVVLDGLAVEVLAADGPSGHPLLANLGPDLRDQLARRPVVVLSQSVSDRLGVVAGDTIGLPGTNGVRQVEVVRVIDTPVLTGDGAVVVGAALLRDRFDVDGPAAIEVVAVPDAAGHIASTAATRERVAGALAGLDAHAEVVTGEELARRAMDRLGLFIGVFQLVQVLIAVATGVALAGLMFSAVAQRQRGVALLRVIGAQRQQVARAVAWEVAAAGVVGLGLGLALGAVLHRAGVITLGDLVRFDIAHRWSWSPPAAGVVVVTLAVLLGGALPAQRAARTSMLQDVMAP